MKTETINGFEPIIFSARIAKMGTSKKGVRRYIVFIPQDLNDELEEIGNQQIKVTIEEFS